MTMTGTATARNVRYVRNVRNIRDVSCLAGGLRSAGGPSHVRQIHAVRQPPPLQVMQELDARLGEWHIHAEAADVAARRAVGVRGLDTRETQWRAELRRVELSDWVVGVGGKGWW